MEGVDDSVELLKIVAVGFGSWPIHDIPEFLSIEMNGFQKFFALQAGPSADKHVGSGERQQRLGFEFVVVAGNGSRVAGMEIVGPSHKNAAASSLNSPHSARRRGDSTEIGSPPGSTSQ